MKYELTLRDEAVLQSIGSFGFLATPHIKSLHFPAVHRISMDRSLARLRKQKLVRRVGVRAVGIKGGTAPCVYALSHGGWSYVQHPGKYRGGEDFRHALILADTFVAMKEAEREGRIVLLANTRVEFSVGEMRPDIFFDFGLPAIKKRRKYYVEIQRNARTDVIGQKINAHWQAFESYNGEGTYPYVAFVVKDPGLKLQISRQIPASMRHLFGAYTPDEFIEAATRQTPN